MSNIRAFLMNSLLLLSLFAITNFLTAQSFFKEAFLDTNEINTIFHNRGGMEGSGILEGLVWPSSGDSLAYILNLGILIGGEVLSALGDTNHIISDGFLRSIDGDFEPGTTNPWGWLALPGYDNPNGNSVALSDDPTTWPPNWQSWPGKFGSGILRADLETYWVMNDSSNAEFPYYPLINDSSFRGLGLEVSCRGYQWDDPQYEDFIIFTYDIKNVSDKPLNKLVVGFFSDPIIGGENDFADDMAGYDLLEDLVFCWDDDGVGSGGIIPGILGFLTLESPNDSGLTSVRTVLFGGNNRPKNDELMWNYMTPGNTNILAQPAYYVLIFGSGYFSLDIGETKSYAIACVLGVDSTDLYQNVAEARNAYSIITDVKDVPKPQLPGEVFLFRNYPNPFNPATNLQFRIPQKRDRGDVGFVELKIFDLLGKEVKTLMNKPLAPGSYKVQWDGRDNTG
ncbi:MAG: hypothetical protein ACE5GL_01805, partial [Calditrichia bacterium]